ncbi:PAS domain-containing protein [Bacillus sp. HMF5848]|uniref:SpoIIE family protein phosphatase n=1 Tax=Bacillus sp. HMF5848 TaxID=2495421 RepID=UPI000F79ADAC|nr:SpoIIE family protein phosphatase [Bacillus sp. HMF5848]RSK26206.1 PAS domain-containing protein [Bacillus sp. HMF5848]
MLEDLFMNITIIVSYLFVMGFLHNYFMQKYKQKISRMQKRNNSIFAGVLYGILGILLMFFGIDFGLGVLIDLRLIAVVLAATFFSWEAPLIAGAIIATIRLVAFQHTEAAIIGAILTLTVAVVCILMKKYYKGQLVILNTYMNIFAGASMYGALYIFFHEQIDNVFLTFYSQVLLAFLGGLFSYQVASYIIRSNRLFLESLDSNSRLQSLIQNMQSAIIVESASRKVSFANQKFYDMLQILTDNSLEQEDSQYIMKLFERLVKGEQNFTNRIEDIVKEQQIVKNEMIFMKDGRAFERDYIPIHSKTGILIEQIWNYRDVTYRYVNELKDQQELQLAKVVQQSVLSDSFNHKEINIQAIYEPSKMLSGDMYAWYKTGEHQYGIIILDVMGHGVASSLVSVSIRALLQGIITKANHPRDVIIELNKHMLTNFRQDDFSTYCTALYATIDTKTRTLTYINAGHPPGLLLSEDKIEHLDKGTIPLGLMELAENIEVGTITWNKDEYKNLILVTDGFTELFDRDNQTHESWLHEVACTTKENSSFLQTVRQRIPDSDEELDDICVISIQLPPNTFLMRERPASITTQHSSLVFSASPLKEKSMQN